MSSKVLFYSNLNNQVENELVGEGKVSTVKLEIVEVLDKVIVGVMNFTKICDGPEHVGEAAFVGHEYYRQLKPRGCYTPSRMNKRQLFK